METREIPVNAENIKEFQKNLKLELAAIIQQVKTLKKRAEEIKEILTQIEGAGFTTPAPVPEIEESQSLPVE